MTQLPMYSATVNSPIGHLETELSGDGLILTLMAGEAAQVLTSVPGRVTLGPRTILPETVIVSSVDGETFTISARTTNQVWPVGTEVARVHCAEDHNELVANIGDLITQIGAIPLPEPPMIKVRGQTTVAGLAPYAPVYSKGSGGAESLPQWELLKASTNIAKDYIIGLTLTPTTTVGEIIEVCVFGVINTSVGEPSTKVYVSWGGGMQPFASDDHSLCLGYSIGAGKMLVCPDKIFDQFHLVAPSSGQTLLYEATTARWRNSDLPGNLEVPGYGTTSAGTVVVPTTVTDGLLNWVLAQPTAAITTLIGIIATGKYTNASNKQYTSRFGSVGAGDGQFNNPYGIAVDSLGNIYVADANNERIQKFTSEGVYILQWGTAGEGDGGFYWPTGIFIDSANNVYVADQSNGNVQKFSSTGEFLLRFGEYGTADGQLSSPFGVVVDSSGNIYVSDVDNGTVQKFSSTGTFIQVIGAKGYGPGQFQTPAGMCIYGTTITVADFTRGIVQSIQTSGAGSVTTIGSNGTGAGQFMDPIAVAQDPTCGDYYVTDKYEFALRPVQVFTYSGAYKASIGTLGTEESQVTNPYGIQVVPVSGGSKAIVIDNGSKRIQVATTVPKVTVEVSGIVPIPSTAIAPGAPVWLGANGTLSATSTGDVPKKLGWIIDSTHLLLSQS